MFIESLAYYKNEGSPTPLLAYHLARIEHTLKHFSHLIPPSFSSHSLLSPSSLLNPLNADKVFSYLDYFNYLKKLLLDFCSQLCSSPQVNGAKEKSSIFKIRFIYDPTAPGTEKLEAAPYVVKRITSLKLVESTFPEDFYDFKYSDRSKLNALYQKRGPADDILIVRSGLVTDSSYANIVLLKDKDADASNWVTPAEPLLKGTAREALLQAGVIKARMIKASDLPRYKRFKLINALRPFNEIEDFPLNIYY